MFNYLPIPHGFALACERQNDMLSPRQNIYIQHIPHFPSIMGRVCFLWIYFLLALTFWFLISFIYYRVAFGFRSFDLTIIIYSLLLHAFPVYWDGLILPIFLVKAISLHYSNVAIFNWIFIYLRVMIGFRSFDLTTDILFSALL